MKKKLFLCSVAAILVAMALPATADVGKPNYIYTVRDNYGVPHVFSDTKEGLGFGAGYAMAEDRLWQADLFRRQSSGRLAELGLATVEQDYEIRKLGYSREELREIYENWVPTEPKARLKEMMEAYVAGINKYISEALEAAAKGDLSLMPVEYLPGAIQTNGLPLEPFTVEDCVAIVVLMAWRFGGTGGNELEYAAAQRNLLQVKPGGEAGWLIFNDLYPQHDPGAEVTIPGKGGWRPGWWPWWRYTPALPDNIGKVYREHHRTKEDLEELFESLGLPTKFGSNAWMVRPWRSETRNALQVGGPQMGQSIPQIVHEMGLHGAGINAVGMMMPFAPAILIGVSEHGAWTSTTGSSDVIDTYIEVLNEDNTRYLHNGNWVEFEERSESICSYSGHCEDRVVYRTIHGPVVALDEKEHFAYTMKAPYYKNEIAAEEGWQLFQQTRNIWEFQEAVKTIQASHNFCWIDRRGNIGYWHAGTFPIKPTVGKEGRTIDDRLPLSVTGEEEWIGLTGFAEMPKCINPRQGYLANWNNKPIANWPYSEVDWGQGHRVKRIQDVLAASGRISFEYMNTINQDAGYNHIPGMNFLHYLVEAAKTDPDDLSEGIGYLEAWNHHYNDVLEPRYPDPAATYDDPGLTIFEAWYGKIREEVFADDLPAGVRAGDSTLIHVFDGPDSKLPLSYDFLNGEDRDEVIVRVLKEALAGLKAEYGSNDISTWLTPVRTVTFDAQGALPAPTMHGMNRGTYNHIAEMPRWRIWKKPHAVDVIPPGQSGFVNAVDGASPHAYDQLLLYETWTYKPMLFRLVDIWRVAESWTPLDYP
jgi:penicillin amidase